MLEMNDDRFHDPAEHAACGDRSHKMTYGCILPYSKLLRKTTRGTPVHRWRHRIEITLWEEPESRNVKIGGGLHKWVQNAISQAARQVELCPVWRWHS